MTPTTEFDYLLKNAFEILYPDGSSRRHFKAKHGDDCYKAVVKPDFVLAGKPWVDFKLKVSYREKKDVPWRPSALYASLRKYIDHTSNQTQKLTIVYGNIFGTINDVIFPICRGNKILIADRDEFEARVQFLHAPEAIRKLDMQKYARLIQRVKEMSQRPFA